METVWQIIYALPGTGVFGVLAWYLIKKLVEKKLADDSVDYQAKIDIKFEELKTNFQKILFEHNTKFANIHARQAEALVNIYSLLSKMERKTRSYTCEIKYIKDSSPQTQNEQNRKESQEAIDAINEFHHYLYENEILFPQELAAQLASFGTDIKKLHLLHSHYFENHDPSISSTHYERVSKDYEELRQRIPSLKEDLQVQFRSILG